MSTFKALDGNNAVAEAMRQINPDGSVYFKVLVKPLVNLIWLAGIVFVIGSVIALWPDARESRRLAERYERAVAASA